MGNRYLIVGGSAAGMAAAHTIRKADETGEVTVLSNESHAPYFRPMIPYIITGKKSASQIILNGSGVFTADTINILTGSKVTSVDPAGKRVTTGAGDIFDYDRILFSSGSRPYMPEDIENLGVDGVFALKTLADAEAMAARSETTEHAVLLGGGILNLKAAFALLEKNIKVTLVVYSPEVLSQLMDPEDAYLVRKALDEAGLVIKTGCSARAVISDDTGVCAVALDNGEEIPCQMICVGKGVIPNLDYLDGTDIRIDKGIVADPFTACSKGDTFAAGDVAVTHDPATGDKTVTALWTHAVEMGICAGLNMTGKKTAYAGTMGIMNATQVADEPFVAMGVVHTRDKDLEVHTDRTDHYFRKMVFSPDGSRLVGAVFVGDITRAGLYRYVIREKMEVERFKNHLVNHTLHYGHFL
ncbi:MAG: NAD(P)/FAD-dependent oxidoreductase [Desulfobacteraceae bacterium]|nr:MAG: NAD(P)/FAD-dependent oxidoreductase [Desulfobacteraceae bacterium]